MSHVSLESTHAAAERAGAALDPRAAQTDALALGIDALCAACVDLAQRIAAGGRLWVLGSDRARADARHLALEFLHPVIVGKRAVPACALDPSEDRRALARLVSPGDAAIAVADAEPKPELWRALAAAQQRGLLTVVLGDTSFGGAHHLDPGARDPLLAKEGRVATYHLLWELTHAMLEESDRVDTPDAAWSQLYPFLGARGASADSVRADLRASGLAKLRELARLRAAAVTVQAEPLARCAAAIAQALDGGAELFSFGNGGSQTDADWVASCFADGCDDHAWRARSLASDPSVLTALANDVGFERIFARQIAALARAGDVALGISTSGSSENVVAGLAEAKRRGLLAVGLAGGDGGRLAQADLDFLFVVPSPSVHRIQEVQAALCHLLYELARSAPGGRPCAS